MMNLYSDLNIIGNFYKLYNVTCMLKRICSHVMYVVTIEVDYYITLE